MKIWLPYIEVHSGVDVYSTLLARVLTAASHDVAISKFGREWQWFPLPLASVPAPDGVEVVIANNLHAFAFKRRGKALISVEHHCVLDPDYAAFRSVPQAIFHETAVRAFESLSVRCADAVVAVSNYTAQSLASALGVSSPSVIHNGIDTDFFCPGSGAVRSDESFRLLYVGNHTRRKGADLLRPILERLGRGYELIVTDGLGDYPASLGRNVQCLGRLSVEELRDAYRSVDVLLFPSRFEGFGYAVAEAMACGTPAICADCSSLPELVEDGITGRLCPRDNIDAFVAAIEELRGNRGRLAQMGRRAREVAVCRFSLHRWSLDWDYLLQSLSR